MWIFTRYGFFSAVNARQGDGKHGNPPDPDRMMVRARSIDHLKALKAAFPKWLDMCEIRESKHTDYRCRMFLPKLSWAEVMYRLVMEQCYDNFKNEAKEYQRVMKVDDHAYVDRLHSVWSVMYGYQSKKYGAGIYDKKSTDLSRFDLEGINQAALAETPDDNDNVLLVLNQDTGADVGVIWWYADAYKSKEEAYADGVEVEVLELVPHPEFSEVTWGSVKDMAIPIFDPYAHSVEGN